MRRLWAAVAVALPLAASAQPSAIDLDQARIYFDELRQLGQVDGGRLWGRQIAGPMLFVDPQSRYIVANMQDLRGALRQEKGVWIGALSPEQSPANTSIDWNGRRWSMVMWPVSDSRYARRRLLIHESFHRIQAELGLPASDRANAHLATAEGRIWTRLEWRALTEALLRSGAERKQALIDALTFRARRRALFPNAAEDERLLELNEGLAEYTGYALTGLPRAALYDRIAVQLANYEQQENFSRSFAYASGPAYSLLLDAAGLPWRNRLNPQSDLSAMTAKAYGVASIDSRTADSRVERYTASRMIAEERARETQRLANEARLRTKFIDGPTVTLSTMGRFNYSFDPNGATPLQNIGTVFESSRVTDEWGVLEVSSGGVLMRRTAGSITEVIVAAPPGHIPPTKGDGWSLQLAAGWGLRPGRRSGDWIASRVSLSARDKPTTP
jgi:hypothetical protein